MSRTELLLSKLRNISALVSIGAFVFFVIVLIFAVINGAITCPEGEILCTIAPNDAIFKSLLWTLFVIMIVFLVTARVLDYILQRESKLVDVNEYRDSLVKKEELSFSQTKIYSDILRTKKSRYTDLSSDGVEEDIFEEEEALDETEPSAPEKTRDTKLSFFARKKLEQAMMEKEESAEVIEEVESDEVSELEPKQTFMDKVKAFNWAFWAKDKVETDELVDDDGVEKEPKPSFMDKVKNVNWAFWTKEKTETDETLDQDQIEEIDKEPKQSFMDKVKNVNWAFWKKEKTEIDEESVEADDEITDEIKEPKQPLLEKFKNINLMFWSKEKSKKSDDFDDLQEIEEETDKSVKTKGSKVALVKEKTKIEEPEIIDESVKEKEFYTRLNKGELVEIVAKATSLSKAKSRLVINSTLDIITEQVKNDDEVRISKFGRFKKVEVKASNDIDPNTGKRVKIEEGYAVKFYPDKVFKDMITEDVDQTGDKSLLTKTVMKHMTETEVEEELYKESKIHEHVDLKVVKEKPVIEEEPVVEEKPTVEEKPIVEEKPAVKEKPIAEEKPVVVKEPVVEEEAVVEKVSAIKDEEIIKVKADIPVAKPAPKKVKVSTVTKTKADLIEYIFETTEISKNKSNKFLGTFGKVIIAELTNGGEVLLEGIGTIVTIVMPAKEAVNPQTKQKITVPEHRQVRMRFSDEFKAKFDI